MLQVISMNKSVIINFLLFQLAWFASVIGAAKGMPWFGVGFTTLVVAWHLYTAKNVKAALTLIIIALIVGAVFDQAMLYYGFIDYQQHGWTAIFGESINNELVPVWILALWLGFTTALNVSLRWMRGLHVVAILFGAIGGPLAYMAAQKLGAVTLYGNQSIIALSVGWAVITPVLLMISTKFDGHQV